MEPPVVDWSRHEESRLSLLRSKLPHTNTAPHNGERTNEVGDQRRDDRLRLNDAERAELDALERRYSQFLEEGEQRLKECRPLRQKLTDTASHVGGGVVFWASLTNTALRGYVGRKLGFTAEYKHWNWITPNLILGALPVITQVGASGNHIELLRQQCVEHSVQVKLVVACLHLEEMAGYGVPILSFAQRENWSAGLGNPIEYINIPITDFSANTSYDAVLQAVTRMHQVVCCSPDRGCAVYVHCKAGKGRSWMVLACYLVSHGGMGFRDAEYLIREQRHQVNPSPSQVQFVLDFEVQFHRHQTSQQEGLA